MKNQYWWCTLSRDGKEVYGNSAIRPSIKGWTIHTKNVSKVKNNLLTVKF